MMVKGRYFACFIANWLPPLFGVNMVEKSRICVYHLLLYICRCHNNVILCIKCFLSTNGRFFFNAFYSFAVCVFYYIDSLMCANCNCMCLKFQIDVASNRFAIICAKSVSMACYRCCSGFQCIQPKNRWMERALQWNATAKISYISMVLCRCEINLLMHRLGNSTGMVECIS